MMEFNEKNYQEVLEALGFTEQRNPNGLNCWDVYNDKGIPVWQYDDDEGQERLYYFFAGALYMKQRISS